MGTIVNNKVSEIILSSVESTVEMHATVLSTVKSDKRQSEVSIVEQNIETDQNNDTVIHTAIMVESVQTEEIVETNETIKMNHKARFRSLIDSDSESDDNGSCNVTYVKPKMNLFDSDIDEDNNRKSEDNEKSGSKHKNVEEIKSKSSKTKSSIKMTGKEAQIQRLEIASASQRRLRESRLSLPYHKPKQRTLKEFLKIRPKISEPLPEDLKHMSTVNAIKLASSRTPEISKKLEEREKILEEFYKSSSESENEEDEHEDKPENSVTNVSNTEDQNKIENSIENSDNKSVDENIKPIDEEPSSIQGILDELQIDYSKFKHQLIKSFLHPSKLIAKMESDIKSFEDQDSEESELISEFELNKIIDTLNTEDSKSTTPSSDHIEIVELSNVNNSELKLTEQFKSNELHCDTSLWKESKCFNELSDDERDDIMVNNSNVDGVKENFILTNGIKSLTPRLTGGKSQIIDLSENVFEKTKGVNKLVERFMQHNAKKSVSPKVVQVRVVTEEIGGFKEEKLFLPVHQEDDDAILAMHEKPGAKLMRLREDLQRKIAQRRTEEWERKQKETKELLGVVDDDEREEEDDFDAIYKNEKDDCCSNKLKGDGDNGADGDDEAEDDVDDEEDIEDDNEFEDEYYKDKKPRKKSDFVDDEAEETDNEDNNEGDDDDMEDENGNEHNVEIKIIEDIKVKPRRRIKEFVEDSSDSDAETIGENDTRELSNKVEESPISKSQNDIFVSQLRNDCDGDEFPLCQPQILTTPSSKCNNRESENNFLSPVQHFTALQSLSLDDTKTLLQSPDCTYTIPHEPSPLKNEKYSPKQLFCDSKIPNTQENLNELMELCSGKFTNNSQALTVQSQQVDFTLTPDAEWTTQRIISGENTQKSIELIEMNGNNLELNNIENRENHSSLKLFTSDDESELELKKIITTKSNTPLPTKNELFTVASSDDDENSNHECNKQRKFVKKKPIKLFCSDDDENSAESSDDDEKNNTDEVSLNEDEEDGVEENEEETHIDYDSEENEIVIEKSKSTRVKDFFDAEAELSEDEHMGSGDESEDDLDVMEREEGDQDNINESKVKRQLEKIHMRQILDEDKRDVRILQELLLEDGDLHSDKGRQRQFKWKNSMGSGLGNDENVQPFDDESELNDAEDQEIDEKWRKTRFEREKVLKEQRLKEKLDPNDIELVIEGDSILKLGQTKLRTSVTSSFRRTSIEKCSTVVVDTVSQTIKKPLGLTNKKGSFLSRTQSTLARLAATTTKSNEIIGGVKNSRNFVFQTLDTPLNNNNNNKNKNSEHENGKSVTNKNVINGKRKATDLDTTPLMFKKLRVAENLDKKVSSRVKQLLNNL